MKTRAKTYQIVDTIQLRRRKSVKGYLYILRDEETLIMAVTDEYRNPLSCSCINPKPANLCPHYKFLADIKPSYSYRIDDTIESHLVEDVPLLGEAEEVRR
jgi:hypothetical protein